MILVTLTNGDTAEAEDPEAAIVAARTLMQEAEEHGAGGRLLRASFYVDGRAVRLDVRRQELHNRRTP